MKSCLLHFVPDVFFLSCSNTNHTFIIEIQLLKLFSNRIETSNQSEEVVVEPQTTPASNSGVILLRIIALTKWLFHVTVQRTTGNRETKQKAD